MAKECGQSETFKSFDEKIGSVMDDVQNSVVGQAAGGIADGIAGLKSKIEGFTTDINSKLESALPEIPEPELNLQNEMKTMMEAVASGDPGVAMDKLNVMKEKFPSVDVDGMLEENGLDSAELEKQRKKFNKQKADADVLAQFSAQKNALGDKFNLTEGQQALLDLGQGKLSGARELLGGLTQDKLIKDGASLDGILDGICTAVPNVDIDAAGNEIKKGIETKVPAEDAEPIEAPCASVILTEPELDQLNELLNQAENIEVTEFDEEIIKIEQKKRQDVQESLKPLQQELNEIKAKQVRGRLNQKDVDRANAINFTANVIRTDKALVANKEKKAAGKKEKPFSGIKTISVDDYNRHIKPHSDLVAIVNNLVEVKVVTE